MIGNNTFLYPSMDDVCAAEDVLEAVSMDLDNGLCLQHSNTIKVKPRLQCSLL